MREVGLSRFSSPPQVPRGGLWRFPSPPPGKTGPFWAFVSSTAILSRTTCALHSCAHVINLMLEDFGLEAECFFLIWTARWSRGLRNWLQRWSSRLSKEARPGRIERSNKRTQETRTEQH